MCNLMSVSGLPADACERIPDPRCFAVLWLFGQGA